MRAVYFLNLISFSLFLLACDDAQRVASTQTDVSITDASIAEGGIRSDFSIKINDAKKIDDSSDGKIKRDFVEQDFRPPSLDKCSVGERRWC